MMSVRWQVLLLAAALGDPRVASGGIRPARRNALTTKSAKAMSVIRAASRATRATPMSASMLARRIRRTTATSASWGPLPC